MELRDWKNGTIGLLLGICLVGCAGFSYRYYGISDVDYSRGYLLGNNSSADLPFNMCAPSEQIKHPCIVLKADEFFKMKQDLEDTKQRLKECEQL